MPKTTTPKPLRVAFIGTGGISHTQASFLKKIPGVEIVAAADVREQALEDFKTKQSLKRVYRDFKEMLTKEKGKVDAVSVCTPNGLHAPNSIAALNAGYHVLVEKPMAMNAKECQTMITAAQKAKRELVCGFQWRFDARSQVIRKQIAEGDFGKILYVRVEAMRRRGIPSWGVFGRKDLQGGGALIDIGVHIIEMAHYLIGSPKPISASGNTWTYLGNKKPATVAPWGAWDHKTYTVEDLAAGIIRFDSGAMMTVESSFAAHIEKDVWNFQILGEKGGCTFDPLKFYKDHDGHSWTEQPWHIAPADGFESKMRHFVEVCRGERVSESSGEHGKMVQQILDGIYGSAQAGQEVKIS